MLEMSRQNDPQAMVRAYGKRVRDLVARDRNLSLSRRDLAYPSFRITRFSEWTEEINPWKEPHRLPLLSGGILAELIYGNRPRLIEELRLELNDPAAEYLDGQGSLIAIPMFDQGESLNMVVSTRSVARGFDPERFPEIFWMASLFGRATHNLVLKSEVQAAFQAVDRELKIVADIQRSLLPRRMPDMERLRLAAHYETSQRAGGDYFDFFPLADGRWGLLIADVSGHGTPAAVVMAVTHSIAHLYPGDSGQPRDLLEFVNQHLTRRYTDSFDAFVTAFYGIFDPRHRTLTYSSAGHNPPRVLRHDNHAVVDLPLEPNFPLGLSEQFVCRDQTYQFQSGDRLVLYTDGIPEAMSPNGEQLGMAGFDQAILDCEESDAEGLLRKILERVVEHTGSASISDDRTLVVAVVE